MVLTLSNWKTPDAEESGIWQYCYVCKTNCVNTPSNTTVISFMTSILKIDTVW